jgi:hypothetical protein
MRTEVRRALPFLLLPLVLFLVGCSLTPWGLLSSPPAQPAPTSDGQLAEGRARWQAAGIRSYHWRVAFGCECLLSGGPVQVTVVDGLVTDVAGPRGPVQLEDVAGFPLTVDAVFEQAQQAIDGGGTADATWSGVGNAFGIPGTLLIDPIKQAVDDELSVSVQSFEPTP